VGYRYLELAIDCFAYLLCAAILAWITLHYITESFSLR